MSGTTRAAMAPVQPRPAVVIVVGVAAGAGAEAGSLTASTYIRQSQDSRRTGELASLFLDSHRRLPTRDKDPS
jgi:hypothetical protein